MKADEKILSLIPEGCKVNWNEKMKRFYVFQSTYHYSKELKRSKEKRIQVGTIVDGVFAYSKSYLLGRELKELKQGSEQSRGDVADKTARLVNSEITDTRQKGKIQYPLAYVYLVALLSSLSGQTNCVQIADYWRNNRPALESILEDFPRQDISHDTVRRLLMLIDPDQFQGFYGRLVEPLLHKFTSRVVAVDGQAVRASKKNPVKGRAGMFSASTTRTTELFLGRSSSMRSATKSPMRPAWWRVWI